MLTPPYAPDCRCLFRFFFYYAITPHYDYAAYYACSLISLFLLMFRFYAAFRRLSLDVALSFFAPFHLRADSCLSTRHAAAFV